MLSTDETPWFAKQILVLIIVILLGFVPNSQSENVEDKDDLFNITIRMPNINTTERDQRVCLQYELPDEELTVIGYTPLDSTNVVHHTITYACAQPDNDKQFWFGDQGCCGGDQMAIYGWARNAPQIVLPEDVGFRLGRNTPFKFIVYTIHYLSIVHNDKTGNQLLISRKPRRKQAGVLSGFAGPILLPPNTQTIRYHFTCLYIGPLISIFAALAHTHRWGRVSSLYRVRDGITLQITKLDPQWPQAFYSLPTSVDVQTGDYLVGQCVYDNNDNVIIHSGPTSNDEMCFVFAMYSYNEERTSIDTQKNDSTPLRLCSNNQFSSLINLIPPDSEVPPIKPPEIGDITSNYHLQTENMAIFSQVNLYTRVQNWPDPNGLPTEWGGVSGIALKNADDELVIFHRGSRKWETKYFTDGYRFRNDIFGPIDDDVLLHVDTHTGQVKSRWGAKMFYMPHGLTIDHLDNYWLTDIALHQVFMFKPNNLTHPILTVGQMFQAGSGHTQLCQPADVAIMRNGDFFVADGYCNSRIVRYNSEGEYITEWGSPTTGKFDVNGFPPPNQWHIVHSLALDEESQTICGADRENYRIQCFDLKTNEFLRQIHLNEGQNIVSIFAIAFYPKTKGTVLIAVTGGKIWGTKVYMINVKTGDILSSFNSTRSLIAPHDIAVSNNGYEIYAGETIYSLPNALHKFEIVKENNSTNQILTHEIHPNNKNSHILVVIMVFSGVFILIVIIVSCIKRLKTKDKIDRSIDEENELLTHEMVANLCNSDDETIPIETKLVSFSGNKVAFKSKTNLSI